MLAKDNKELEQGRRHKSVSTVADVMKDLNYRMSQNDVPDIALKVYKISSRKFFDGRHQTERILDNQAAG
jgi:hypothetical protein